MKEYMIVSEYDDVSNLEKLVDEYLMEGWELEGGVSVAVYPVMSDQSIQMRFYQAMSKSKP